MLLSKKKSLSSSKSFTNKDTITSLKKLTSQIQHLNKDQLIRNLRKSTIQIQQLNKQRTKETSWVKKAIYVVVGIIVASAVIALSVFINNSMVKNKVSKTKTSDIRAKLMSTAEWKIFTEWIRRLPKYPIRESFTALPLSDVFDIRTILCPVKNQGSCGSCAIYSIVGVLSDMYSREESSAVDLSSQYIINCLYDCANKKKLSVNVPCQGNYPELLGEFFIENNPLSEERACPNGTVLESCVSTNECIDPTDTKALMSLKCPTQCTVSSVDKPKHYYIQAVYQIYLKETDFSISEKIGWLKDFLKNYGSIGVAVALTANDFARMAQEAPFIPSKPSEKDELFGHAMVLIGWKNDTWIIRNSWGTCDPLYGYVYWKIGTGLEDTYMYCLEI